MKARLAGFFYLLTFLTAIPVVLVSSKLFVSGDAALTAANIVAHETLFRLGFAAYLGNLACYLAVTLLFHELFEPVGKSISLLAVFFSLMGCAVQAVSTVFYLAPLVLLGGAPYLAVFKPEQLQALALASLKVHALAYNAGLVFFGFYCLLVGVLVFKSGFLPRVLGVLMACAGLAWLTFAWPPLASAVAPYNLALGVLGEGSLTLWLLILGVRDFVYPRPR